MLHATKRILLTMTLSISCLAFVQTATAAATTCTLTHIGSGDTCSTGLYIKNAEGVVLNECQDRFAAQDSFVSLVKGGLCLPSSCSLQTPAQCANSGGYAVTNQDGELISPCDTGRAAIDDLNSLVYSGVCVPGGH